MPEKKFTFICGGDDFLVARMGKSIYAQKTRDLADDFSMEIIDGAANNVAEVESAMAEFKLTVQTLPLFGDKKVIWFKGVNFLGDTVTGKAAGTLAQVESLQALLSQFNPSFVDLVITAYPVDRRRSFLKWCERHADFYLAGSEKKRELSLLPLIEEECLSLGVTIDPDAREVLLAKLGGNTRLVIEELRKLATYLGEDGTAITEEMVAELVPNFGEGNFFEAVEAFYSFDLEWTLAALRRHFFTQRDARGIITAFQGRNRLLIQLRVLFESGEIGGGYGSLNKASLQKIALTYKKHFGEGKEKSNFNVFTQNPWYLGRLLKIAKQLPLKKLIRFQAEFLRAFEEILSRPEEPEAILRDIAVQSLGG